jgi:hypothetical protein
MLERRVKLSSDLPSLRLGTLICLHPPSASPVDLVLRSLSYANSANNNCEDGKSLYYGSCSNTLYQYSPVKTAWLTALSRQRGSYPHYSEQFPAAGTWSELSAATRYAARP